MTVIVDDAERHVVIECLLEIARKQRSANQLSCLDHASAARATVTLGEVGLSLEIKGEIELDE